MHRSSYIAIALATFAVLAVLLLVVAGPKQESFAQGLTTNIETAQQSSVPATPAAPSTPAR